MTLGNRAPASAEAPTLIRRSPIQFGVSVVDSEVRDAWDVALAVEDEGDGPWLVDLSHRARWDLQDRDVDDQRPFGLTIPGAPGQVTLEEGLVISRMNQTQVAIGHVGPSDPPATPPGAGYTETTDSHAWLALVGRAVPDALERISNLDLFCSEVQTPHLTQGPIIHIPSQVVVCGFECVLIAIARGYGQGFVDAFLNSTSEVGTRPAGERRFADWIARSERLT